MKGHRLHTAVTIGLVALTSLAAVPAHVAGQCPAPRRGEAIPEPPNPQAPRVLIPTFHGDGAIAAPFSQALRERLRIISDEKSLWVIRCERQNQLIVSSGYKADSALGPNDFSDLGRNLGATESMDGDVWKGTDGKIHVNTRAYYLNNVRVYESLPEAVAGNVDDLANKVADEYRAARKEFDAYGKCVNLARDGKGDAALAAARAARVEYPSGFLPRVCMMNALTEVAGVSQDSIIAAAEAVLASDSANRRAVGILADAYRAKGDTANAVRNYLRYWNLDHSDAKGAQTVISVLAQSGAPDQAIPIIDTLLKSNPADVELRNTALRIYLRSRQYKQAYVVFEALVKADTSAATLENFQRMIAAAQADSNPQMILQYLARATQRFPTNASMLIDYSVYLKDAGQLQQALDAAKRAVAVDPKVAKGYGWVLTLYGNLNEPDSTLAFAKRALAAGADTAVVDGAVLKIIAPVVQKAQTDSASGNWQAALDLSRRVDSIVPSQVTKFYIGVSAISVAKGMTADINALVKTDKAKACAELNTILDLANESYDAMTSGGGGHRDPTNAGIIMQAVPSIRGWVAQSKAALTTAGFVCK